MNKIIITTIVFEDLIPGKRWDGTMSHPTFSLANYRLKFVLVKSGNRI